MGQLHMETSWAVARFAADIDFGKGGSVGGRFGIEVFLQVGGMAVRAHEVPTLPHAGPVQLIVRFKFLMDIGRREVEPAFPVRVPRFSQHLDLADFMGQQVVTALDLHHVLLERIDSKDILDLEIRHFAVRSLGVDEELLSATKHAGGYAVVLQFGVVEVGQDRLGGRQLHGECVMRILPVVNLLLVTFQTAVLPDVRSRGIDGVGSPPVGEQPSSHKEKQAQKGSPQSPMAKRVVFRMGSGRRFGGRSFPWSICRHEGKMR
jgi:hypothetical protein